MRITSASVHALATADMQRASLDLFEAQRQTGSERKAEDLKGYGPQARTLVSARSYLARAEAYAENGVNVQNRLAAQDLALGEMAAIAQDLRILATETVGLDNGRQFDTELERIFDRAKAVMNTDYAGQYIFSGVSEDTPPVPVGETLADLQARVDDADVLNTFANAPRPVELRVSAQVSVEVAPLADDVAGGLFQSIRRLANAGPYGDPLTDAQKTSMQNELETLAGVVNELNAKQADNGAREKRVDNAINRAEVERDYFEKLVTDIQGVDLAEVASRLSQAQTKLQASASVYATVRDATLLNFLR